MSAKLEQGVCRSFFNSLTDYTYVCALGMLRGMCAYLCVCAGGVEGDVCIPMCVRWGC